MSENQNGMNGKDFLLGAIVGGIIGATTALLLAPKEGKEVREDLSRQYDVLKDKAQDWSAIAKEKGSEWGTMAKEKGTQLSSVVKERSEDWGHTVKTVSTDVAAKAKELGTDVTNRVKERLNSNDNLPSRLQSAADEVATAGEAGDEDQK